MGLLVANTTTEDGVVKAEFIGANNEVVDSLTQAEIAALVADLADVVNTDYMSDTGYLEQLNYRAQTAQVLKAQVVQTDAVTNDDTTTYTVQPGDTLADIAENFGVSENTIKWANGMTTNTLARDAELTIPPIDGVVYTVQAGDTAEKLAEKYKANAENIIAFNDAEITGLVEGATILIPDGEKPAPVIRRTRYVARSSTFYNGNYTMLANGTYKGKSVYGLSPSNFYGGWCTWWADIRSAELGNNVAASVRARGGGNASAWHYKSNIRRGAPKVGDVLQTSRAGWGHVGVVEAVSADGKSIKYSDMNGMAGFGRAAITKDWVPVQGHWYFLYQ